MFGYKYIKFDSMTYVIRYRNGKAVQEGKGLSFFYFSPTTSIVAIPAGSDDINFIFKETTADYQEVTVQGKITYKIKDPKQLAALLDYTVNEKGMYKSADYEKLSERVINVAQTATAAYIRKLSLKEAIVSSDELEKLIAAEIENSATINALGLEPLGVNVQAVRATPEMSRALEAKAREELQKEADKAIYERRNFAVEQERTIRQSELNTEIAVEQKKKEIAEKQMEREVSEAENERRIREMKIDADVAVEEKRKVLTDIKVENEKKEADARGYAIQTSIAPFRDLDWKMLMALNQDKMDPGMNISMAFRELAENAGKIEILNISPELLNSLTQPKRRQ